jgi:hypothetical protein
MSVLGRALLYIGSILIILGAAVVFIDKIPFIGKLPGDFLIKYKNVTIFFPLMTILVLSLILSAILNISRK